MNKIYYLLKSWMKFPQGILAKMCANTTSYRVKSSVQDG